MTGIVVDAARAVFLEEASTRYVTDLMGPGGSPGVEYLKSRGLSKDKVLCMRLGYVENPLPGHDAMRGMISIPYITRAGVTAIRFRRIGENGPKYRSEVGEPPRIYNAEALLMPSDVIAITEGEFDSMAAHGPQLPSTGIGGVDAWKDYFRRCYKGYKAVFILADADDKGQGMEFAEKVAAQVKNARICPMPEGHDVNSFILEHGYDALLERLEIKQ